MSDSSLYNQGLERFAMGDLDGAARLWLAALIETPDHPQLRAYLDHVRAVQPALVASIEAEAGLAGPAADRPPTAGPAPLTPLSIPEYAAPAPATPSPPALAPIPIPMPVSLQRGSSTPRPGRAPGRGETGGGAAATTPSPVAVVAPGHPAAAPGNSTAAPSEPAAAPPDAAVQPSSAAPAPRTALVPVPPAALTTTTTHSGFVIPAPPPVARPSATKGQPAPASTAAIETGNDPWRDGETPVPPVQVTSQGPGLSIVEATRGTVAARRPDLVPMLERLRTLVSLDNFTGTLELAQQILRHVPDHPEAKSAYARSQSRLSTMYGSRIGRLDAVPRVRVQPREVIWLDLDHRAGFVLSQVDGQSSFEEILELTGMERLETMRILADLVGKGIIDVPR